MEELAQHGSTGIAIAVVGILFWVIKMLMTKFEKALDNQADAIRSQAEATQMFSVKLGESMEADIRRREKDEEVLQFMKNLNGKLTGAMLDTAVKNRKSK